jgi:hypothetical protein
VHFDGDNWNIHFGKGKEFYKVPVSTKLAEIEKKATALGGRKIILTVTAGPINTLSATEPVVSVPMQVPQTSHIIREEEPFVKADFSAETKATPVKKTAKTKKTSEEKSLPAAEVPDELKGILGVIDGEVLA